MKNGKISPESVVKIRKTGERRWALYKQNGDDQRERMIHGAHARRTGS